MNRKANMNIIFLVCECGKEVSPVLQFHKIVIGTSAQSVELERSDLGTRGR